MGLIKIDRKSTRWALCTDFRTTVAARHSLSVPEESLKVHDNIYSLTEVMAMTGYCRHSLVRKAKDGSFPSPKAGPASTRG